MTTPEMATCACGHKIVVHELRTPTKANPARRGECTHADASGLCKCPGPR